MKAASKVSLDSKAIKLFSTEPTPSQWHMSTAGRSWNAAGAWRSVSSEFSITNQDRGHHVFDTTSGRGVGLMSLPLSAFSGTSGDALLSIANQQGGRAASAYSCTRRLNGVWTGPPPDTHLGAASDFRG